MRSFKSLLSGVALVAATVAVQPAQALTFTLNNTGGAEVGTAARRGFDVATAYWSSVFTNNANITLDIGFRSLGPNLADVVGQTGSSVAVATMGAYQSQLRASASNSRVDQLATANLPTLTDGAVSVITPGYVDNTAKTGINTRARVYDTDGSTNNSTLYVNTANAKAMGYDLGQGPVFYADNNTRSDGVIEFNSDFAFDFDPTDGESPNTQSFVITAIHEIGHALGFVSGVDNYDYYGGPNGPCFNGGPNCGGIAGSTYDANSDTWAAALDLFRYTSDPDNLAPGGAALDWSIRNGATDGAAFTQPYFSIDGGDTALFGNLLSRGQFNTNSYQASHWRTSAISGQRYLGIMDPIAFPDGRVTALDIAAFDAIGWNSNIDAIGNPTYSRDAASIYRQFAGGVPEPATWAQMLLGFGLIGFAARGRRRSPAAA